MSTDDPRVETPWTELAPGYRVLGHLSRGNRLDIYDAWSDERDSRCVLKTLRPDRALEPRARRSLETEGRLLRRFAHPHLVRAYEVTHSRDGRPVVVLETLAGETLSHLVHRLGDAGHRLPIPEVAELGRQLCSVIGYLHRQDLLHLDVKPDNIVAENGRARLIDLSLARRPGWARGGAGTFEYMAPEQVRGGALTTAADVWGLGAVLFAAFVGWPPFGYAGGPDESDACGDDMGHPQVLGRAPSIARARRIPSELASLVDACLEPDPVDRPAVAELARGLGGWLERRAGGP